MSERTQHDPVLGTLRYRGEWSSWSLWVSRIWFTPKHPLTVIIYEDESRPRTLQQQILRARDTYLKIRGQQWGHRRHTAREVLAQLDPERVIGNQEIEALARQLRLVRVELFDDTSAGMVFQGPAGFEGQEIDVNLAPGGDFSHASLSILSTFSGIPTFHEEDAILPS